ncbi:MAG: ABC transporter substrate-binding protein [Candidatus Binatia bacterium]
MAVKHGSILPSIIAFVFSAGMSTVFSSDTRAADKLTMESIIKGAKKEGKISWGTNLQEHEVVKLNKAFQKEYPFIKEVSYSRVRGAEEHERILSEMQAGTYPYDMLHVQDELIARYTDLGFLMDPVDWKGLFGVDPRMMHPKGFGIAVGNNPTGIAYNRRKVPKERVPTKWSDCYDPFFKGKVSVDVRPSNMHSLIAGYGEEWTLDFARKLAANEPRWIRGNTQAILLVAAGEVLISCPGSHGSWYRQASRKPNFPVEFVFPDGPVLAGRDLLLSPLKGSVHPNTALLLTGWVAAKGVTYLDTGRDSLFHPGTKLGAKFKQTNREIKIQSWEDIALTNQRTRKILEVWGFPKPGK